MISKFIVNDFHFWNVSIEVLARIEGTSYASNIIIKSKIANNLINY